MQPHEKLHQHQILNEYQVKVQIILFCKQKNTENTRIINYI